MAEKDTSQTTETNSQEPELTSTETFAGLRGRQIVPGVLSTLIGEAVRDGATDVHIDPVGDEMVLRSRVDGIIREWRRLASEEGSKLVNQVKVAADMEIDVGFEPQEGQFQWWDEDQSRDVRATVVPTLFDESAHLRLLQSPQMWRNIRNLGMSATQIEQIESLLTAMHGLVLIAGRTGGGKTTTMYSVTDMLGIEDKIAASVEDPVEFDVPYMRQLEVNDRLDLSMGEGLRILLRTDPDILLVGEVRDQASAATAARAGLAGRLVMATVHGRDAAGTFEAMHYQGVPYHVLGGALQMIIAQDLVRQVCRHCGRSRNPDDDDRRLFEQHDVPIPDEVLDPVGCEHCRQSGYRGRTGVFEIVPIDHDWSHFLSRGPHQHEFRRRARSQGLVDLTTEALRKAGRGVTSMSEVRRVGAEDVDENSDAGMDATTR